LNCKEKRICHEEEKERQTTQAKAAGFGDAAPAEAEDPVVSEAKRWAELPEAEVAKCTGSDGMVDEFKLHAALKNQFPLHYDVFRQTASHLPSEGNSEQLFSQAKHRADPNRTASNLRLLTKTAANKHKYKPAVAAIWKRYQEKYKGLPTHYGSDGGSDSGLSSSSDSDSSDSD
jgi:hypothetical protein